MEQTIIHSHVLLLLLASDQQIHNVNVRIFHFNENNMPSGNHLYTFVVIFHGISYDLRINQDSMISLMIKGLIKYFNQMSRWV